MILINTSFINLKKRLKLLDSGAALQVAKNALSACLKCAVKPVFCGVRYRLKKAKRRNQGSYQKDGITVK